MYLPATERIDKPRDKKTNYVKRCVGIAGDSLQIKDGIVFVNGKELILPERAKPQYFYKIILNGDFANEIKSTYDITEYSPIFEIKNEIWNDEAFRLELIERFGFKEIEKGTKSTFILISEQIDQELFQKLELKISDSSLYGNLTFEKYEKLKRDSRVKIIERRINREAEDGVFPDFKDRNPSVTNNWNGDNFGPIYIPQAGKTVALNKETLPLYKLIITEYEGNTLEVKGNEIKINGKIATSYTFKQDYYWMMGDNRHNSLDARYFGYTPADHIVGKPIFIWMSLDWNAKGLLNKFRTERFFTTVSGEGQPESYFKYFLFLLAGYFAWDWYRNKKKKKETDLL
jgi:signal peptidase I